MSLFWLSFCDPSKPEGKQFLGVCIVHGGETGDPDYDMLVAVSVAHLLGCNPGGEVSGKSFSPELEKKTSPKWTGRILSKDECAAFDEEMTKFAPS